MILVMLGTQNNSFERLLNEVQKCIDKKVINEEVIVQAGATKFQSKDMKIFKIITVDELNKYIEKANFVITHGGVGSIVTCLKLGKKVIAVPRYHKYGEHVNDHQLQIIETFDGQGLVKGLREVQDLENAIEKINDFNPVSFTSNNQNVISIIENYIENNKKVLFSAYSLDLGGIEKALVSIVNKLQSIGYEVTVVLEKKEGIFLDQLDRNVKVITYSPSYNKNIFLRKGVNFLKRLSFILKYKNRFAFSASFATYSLVSSFVARVASKNACLWGHADYLTLFKGNESETKKFFNERKVQKFKKIVFVSNEGKRSFIRLFPDLENKTITCNNLINGEKIIELSEENVEIKKEIGCTYFLNVGRHEEIQKKLTRIIEASKRLMEAGYAFKVLLVGDGPNNKEYRDLVKKYKLDNYIVFVGKKSNPYPYFKIADCVILTSDYEGYPVVLLESYILNKPIITTKVSDWEDVEGKHGYVAEKNSDDIFEKMKMFIEKGYEISEKFDYIKYNEEIMKKLKTLID